MNKQYQINKAIDDQFVKLYISSADCPEVSRLLDAGKNLADCKAELAKHSTLERTLEVLDGSGWALLNKEDDARDGFRAVKALRDDLLVMERQAEEEFQKALYAVRKANDKVSPIKEEVA